MWPDAEIKANPSLSKGAQKVYVEAFLLENDVFHFNPKSHHKFSLKICHQDL